MCTAELQEATNCLHALHPGRGKMRWSIRFHRLLLRILHHRDPTGEGIVDAGTAKGLDQGSLPSGHPAEASEGIWSGQRGVKMLDQPEQGPGSQRGLGQSVKNKKAHKAGDGSPQDSTSEPARDVKKSQQGSQLLDRMTKKLSGSKFR